jgi:hypothetical protein
MTSSLVSRFRSLQTLAAPSVVNSGIKGRQRSSDSNAGLDLKFMAALAAETTGASNPAAPSRVVRALDRRATMLAASSPGTYRLISLQLLPSPDRDSAVGLCIAWYSGRISARAIGMIAQGRVHSP